MALRLLMLGTGTFALPTFRGLFTSGHQVVGLVTQPDRVGRGHHNHPHPMKEEGIVRDVPVFQPDQVNSPESLDRLRAFEADVFVVAAYGQILSAELLAIPRWGAINLHASLLPRHRGAAPVQYAVWKGDAETGVTIFRIEPRLDAGPVLGLVRTPIHPTETSGALEDRLAELSVPLTLTVLDQIEHGTTQPAIQPAEGVTRARKLKKEQGQIDWSQTMREIDCHIRAMQPWPMPFAWLHSPGKPPLRLLVLQVAALSDHPRPIDAVPGTVLDSPPGRLCVACGDGVVEVLRVQPSGKRPMETVEFLRGNAVTAGHLLSAETPPPQPGVGNAGST